MSFSSDTHPGSSYVPPTNASPTHGDDSTSLRADLDALKEQLAAFVARAGSDAMKTAREATADVANQVGSKASEVANQVGNKASELANTASEQAKTFASELERVARNNPLGALAGALVVGVVIGLIGRRH